VNYKIRIAVWYLVDVIQVLYIIEREIHAAKIESFPFGIIMSHRVVSKRACSAAIGSTRILASGTSFFFYEFIELIFGQLSE
jgi:hypothetical protein